MTLVEDEKVLKRAGFLENIFSWSSTWIILYKTHMFNQFGFTQFDLLFMYIVPEFCSFLLPSFHNISLLICVVPGLRNGEDTSTRWRKAKYFSDLSLGTDHMEHYDTKQILKVIWKDVRSWKGTHPPKADPGCLLHHWLKSILSVSRKLTFIIQPTMLPHESNHFAVGRIPIFLDYHVTKSP